MKTISMPLDEYENDLNSKVQKAYENGIKVGQTDYLKVIKQLVIHENIDNCSIMWGRMDSESKAVFKKLINTYVTKTYVPGSKALK